MNWAAFYGLAALGLVIFSRTSPKRSVRAFSLMLLLYWALANFFDSHVQLTDMVEISALMDAVGMSLAINAGFQHFRWWKAALAFCFGIQLLTHIGIMFAPESRTSLYQYALALNLLFTGQLASVATPTAVFHINRVRTHLARRRKQRAMAAPASSPSRQNG